MLMWRGNCIVRRSVDGERLEELGYIYQTGWLAWRVSSALLREHAGRSFVERDDAVMFVMIELSAKLEAAQDAT